MNNVVSYYSSYDEKDRIQYKNNLERIRTEAIISRYLPKNRIRILDIGGAAGIYSFWLSKLGHSVNLIDFTPKHILQANAIQNSIENKLESIILGNALNLPFEDNTFDVVLLMGPLYHLQDRIDRVKALRESYRVLKYDGIGFIAAISRYASMFDGYMRNMVIDPVFYEIMQNDIKSGIHQNKNNPAHFTDAYFHDIYGLMNEIIEAGYKYEKIIPVEGFAFCIHDIETKIENEEYKNKLLKDLYNLEHDHTIIGLSPHYLGIAKK